MERISPAAVGRCLPVSRRPSENPGRPFGITIALMMRQSRSYSLLARELARLLVLAGRTREMRS